ncbi:hypothetical protein PHYPSEUDO_002090 [Phytophthora pseudosyringae]|uniref:Uncharacterized protein n=1 Tax=Phytophthora pseudosyringae TaxID=221518 RepID=A0A8T1VZA1_9STRA|nr:hypothetical protein PHYPSEUDO_002090 [Phytophthora pseudosyringae]
METHEDRDFLDEVTGFLDQCEGPDAPVVEEKPHEASATRGDDGLLLATHQLLAETEELLASCTAPVDNKQEEGASPASTQGKSSQEDTRGSAQHGKVSVEQRRQIRNAQAAKRRLRYRRKLKGEKETLKQHENELTTQLTGLQVAQAELKAKQASSLTFGAWRAVAARQLERRLQAEQQQKVLRAEVAGRARLIQQLNLLLQSNPRCKFVSWETMEKNGDVGGSVLFKTMLDGLDAVYLRTDDVWHGLEFKSTMPLTYNMTRKCKEGVTYFDGAERTVFPYDFEQAVDVMSIVMMADPEKDLNAVHAQDLEDTVTVKYRLKYELRQGECANFVVYGVARKYREKDRLVFLWRSFTEGTGEFDGFHSDETTWIILRPGTETSGVNCGQSCTVLESYSRMVPVGFGSAPGCDEDVDRFVKILAELGEEESKQMMVMMEKLIIGP